MLRDENQKKDSIICGATWSPITKQMTYGGRNENDDLIKPNGTPQICETINGNFVLIPKYVYEKNGTLDSFFSHAIGDFDYGLRARKNKINSYTSSKFIGECEKPDSLPKWCLPEIALPDRLKVLYSPKGYSQPFHQFVFEKRHFGIRKALFHYITIHLRVFFPSLWNNNI
jgi:GT2 family glycosyltransferase